MPTSAASTPQHRQSSNAPLEVRVGAIRELTPRVRELTLESTGGPLPGFSAGSHIQVVLPLPGRTLRNAYSLTGDPNERRHYRIAVYRRSDSRGGSAWLHSQLAIGDRLGIGLPSNLFALHPLARHQVLVAGGIGITPFLAYAAELLARGASFELHYSFRGRDNGAYLTYLAELLGPRLHGYDSSAGQRLDVTRLLAGQPLGSHVYVCGPQGLIDALRSQSLALGWPAGRVHFEVFAAPQPGVPFSVQLKRDGRRLQVGADESLLEALEAAGVALPNLCRGGVCGQCRTHYLDGEVEHRDHYLTAAERGHALMPCVSRGGCHRPLLLDL